MTVIMQCQGDPLGGEDHTGDYLKSAEFPQDDPHGKIEFTSNVDEALEFASFPDALRKMQFVHPFFPRRPDNKPNRPLTAWNWIVEMKGAPE